MNSSTFLNFFASYGDATSYPEPDEDWQAPVELVLFQQRLREFKAIPAERRTLHDRVVYGGSNWLLSPDKISGVDLNELLPHLRREVRDAALTSVGGNRSVHFSTDARKRAFIAAAIELELTGEVGAVFDRERLALGLPVVLASDVRVHPVGEGRARCVDPTGTNRR
ncbi:hypothetical protein [Aquabacterium humicola]|uniref:hypothetical protein n=1 Tax=Aquabacterium humicola TaxID=3237377 RepID=UPI002542D50C|nr:hypothetical protein [Rubrivivax pictus]